MSFFKKLSLTEFICYAVIGILTFLATVFSEWNDDAIAYSFFIPRYGEDTSCTPIESLGDIWNSQINHWFNSNGRFVIHFIVQIFCGLAGKYWFALINSIVWIGLLKCIVRFHNNNISWKFTILVSSLILILFFPLPFTPPFQINYVWTALAISLWLKLFFSDHNISPAILIVLAIFSFVTGQMHEGFSIPVCGALVYYIIYRKGHFSVKEWILAVSFGIGSILTIFAPGNFWRINQESSSEGSVLNLIEQLPSAIWFPLIFLILVYASGCKFKTTVKFLKYPPAAFLIVMATLSLAFNILIGRIGRGIIPYNLSFILLSVLYLQKHKLSLMVTIAAPIIAITIISLQISRINTQNKKTNEIIYEYMDVGTSDGTIYIDNDLFLFNRIETTQRRNTYTNKLRQTFPDAPFLKIYPASMKTLEFMKDTNMVVNVGEQSWVCIQSASHPRDFIVEKTVLPSFFGGKRMNPRILDFSSGSEIFIDSTADYKSILYVNDRPYVNAEIIIR